MAFNQSIMKKILLLLLFLFSANCFAQNKTIDSIKQLLSTAQEDTCKVWLIGALSENYIIKATGGEINVVTKEGDGSEFNIQLPQN